MSELDDLTNRNAQLEASLDRLTDRILAASAEWNQERDRLVKALKDARQDLIEWKRLYPEWWFGHDEETLAKINAVLAEIDKPS